MKGFFSVLNDRFGNLWRRRSAPAIGAIAKPAANDDTKRPIIADTAKLEETGAIVRKEITPPASANARITHPVSASAGNGAAHANL